MTKNYVYQAIDDAQVVGVYSYLDNAMRALDRKLVGVAPEEVGWKMPQPHLENIDGEIILERPNDKIVQYIMKFEVQG